MSTSILKSFIFPQPKPNSDPLIIKRERMVSRLEDQKKAGCRSFIPEADQALEKKEGGEKVLVEKPIRTSKWWQQDQRQHTQRPNGSPIN